MLVGVILDNTFTWGDSSLYEPFTEINIFKPIAQSVLLQSSLLFTDLTRCECLSQSSLLLLEAEDDGVLVIPCTILSWDEGSLEKRNTFNVYTSTTPRI